jgi:hypothetical protein
MMLKEIMILWPRQRDAGHLRRVCDVHGQVPGTPCGRCVAGCECCARMRPSQTLPDQSIVM